MNFSREEAPQVEQFYDDEYLFEEGKKLVIPFFTESVKKTPSHLKALALGYRAVEY